MKRLIPFLVVTSIAFTNALFAQEEAPSDDIKVKGIYNSVGRARFRRTESERHHHLDYAQGLVYGIYKHKLQNHRTVNVGAGYMGTHFHFSHHPKRTSFRQEHFDNVLFRLGASTRELHHWKWKFNLDMQIDPDHFSLSRYTYFVGVLRGRYKYHDKRHLHIGILALTGMHYTRVLPIVGIDYVISDKWQFDAVFPTKMALIYSITPQWKLDTAIRYFFTRQRFGIDEHWRRGLVAYTNWGAEVGVNYALSEKIRFNAHVGDAFAGRMRISTHHDHDRKHLKLDSSVYYGFTATLIF